MSTQNGQRALLRPVQDWLDGEDFYNMMQTYRHWPMVDQHGTVAAFEAIKDAIRREAAADLVACELMFAAAIELAGGEVRISAKLLSSVTGKVLVRRGDPASKDIVFTLAP